MGVQVPPRTQTPAHFPRFHYRLNTRPCDLPLRGDFTGLRGQAALQVPGGAGNPPRAHRLTASADRLASLARQALPSKRFGHRLHGELVSPVNAVAVALVAPGAGELGLGHQSAANASGASSAIASAPPAASAPPDVGRWRSGSQVRYQGELLLIRQKAPSWQQMGRVRANARVQAGTS